MLRERRLPSFDAFPPDPWSLAVVKPEPEMADDELGQTETMFALSNGYLGIRGTLDEGRPIHEPGTFLNGFYEYRPINYGEKAYGFPERGQSMLNCPDGLPIKLFVDGEAFDMAAADILAFERRLDFREGVLHRLLEWRTQTGKRFHLHTSRLVSFADRHLAAIEWELTLPEGGADVAIVSDFVERYPLPPVEGDPRIENGADENAIELLEARHAETRSTFLYRTRSSGFVLGCGMDHHLESDSDFAVGRDAESEALVFRSRCAGGTVKLRKYLAYHYGRADEEEAMLARVGATLDEARRTGFRAIRARQEIDMAAFWKRADVEVESSDSRLQQVIRWNLFQLFQASQRAEGHSIGVRGLTGRTYEGHYFWDTEIYVLPFLIYTAPEAARNVLHFRYRTLDNARERAAELGHRGAAFPWRTINGEEASAYYAAGTAQYHINADISYAIRKYVEVTGDEDFLHRHGTEILVETARFWRDLGFFSKRRDGQFCINGVTGPDEYNAVVDNNYFTNLMASENMAYAAEIVERMKADAPEAYRDLVARTGLEAEETGEWRQAAELMYLPYDERLQVHPQDDGFLDKEPWDFDNTPEEHYPLLLHYHPLNLYRAQVIKQADTLLAMFLLGDRFTEGEKKRNFDYYDPITTHDSSLSVCIQSIVANEIGYRGKALDYFRFAAVMDLSDVGGNMKHGAHIASIGGTWMAMIYGFGGMRDYRGRISFHPALPDEWPSMQFCLRVRGQLLRIEIDHAETTYRLLEGERLVLWHVSDKVELTAATPQARRATPRSKDCDPPRASEAEAVYVPGA